ncbi:MAG: AsmA family protein [Halioglobus sp.]
MRKVLILATLLAVILLLPLGVMSSERALLFLAHWGVDTFTDYRLVLRQPVLRPIRGEISASEVHLYPKAELAPPFLSVLGLRGIVSAMDIYRANLGGSDVEARQVTIYVSSNDNTRDPAPFEWLQYLGWLPQKLEIGQLHVVTASNKTLVFPLRDISGYRADGAQFIATAQAEYEGEPLGLQMDIAAASAQQEHAGIILNAAFTALESGSEVRLAGEIHGTPEQFKYDFRLDADYQDVGQFLQAFDTQRAIKGALTVRARMIGDTQGFTLSDALFVLDNMPEYRIEANGAMEYDVLSGNQLRLAATGELSSMDRVLEWIDIDLRPLGSAAASATITGSLEHPVIDDLVLRSENDNGLIVSIQGRVDPKIDEDTENRLKVDIQGPTLQVLSHWTGPLPHDPGAFSLSALLVGNREQLRVTEFTAEVGSRASVLLQMKGEAKLGEIAEAKGLAAIQNAAIELSIFSPNSAQLAPYVGFEVPQGFEISGQVSLEGSGDELQVTNGKVSAISSDVVLTLEPDKGTLRLQNENLLTNLRAEISAYLSDTSALSQFLSTPVPVLGEVNGQAQAVQHDGRLSLERIQFSLDADGPRLSASGRVDDIVNFKGVTLKSTYANIEARDLITTALQSVTYTGELGQLEGGFDLGNTGNGWSLENFRMNSVGDNNPLQLAVTGELKDLTGLPAADFKLQYRLRDPSLLQAITGLRMNPSEGGLTLKSHQGTTNAIGNVRFGDTQITAEAILSHDTDSLHNVTMVMHSPNVRLEDLGLQAEQEQDVNYSPADQLDDIKPWQRFRDALRQAPRYQTDIAVNFDGITGDHTNIESFHLHFTGSDNRYTLRRLSIAYDQSISEIRGIIDLNSSPPFASLAGEALAIPMDTLSRDLGLDFDITGIANVRGGLSSQGNSPDTLMDSLDGSLAVALKDAVIEGAAYDVLATDLLAWFYSGAALEDSTRIDCAMAHFVLDDGIAASDSLYIETRKMVATGDARLDLGKETLDVKFTPLSKSRSLQVPSSIRLKGKFDDPKVTISPVAAAFDAYAEVLTLLPRMARRIFGSEKRKRNERPCEPTPA